MTLQSALRPANSNVVLLIEQIPYAGSLFGSKNCQLIMKEFRDFVIEKN